jgi:hypothetical protein
MTWRNTLKLAKGADNPSVDLVNTISVGALNVKRQVITFRQVGVVKSVVAVGQTSTSASVLVFITYSKKDVCTWR